jgi:hypothetical protein
MLRRLELEQQLRSLAMLTPQAPALDREQAMRLLAELRDVQAQLADVLAKLRAIVDHE